MRYFFRDLNNKNKCPNSFIERIVINLDMELYQPGETIVTPGQQIENLRFVYQGSCLLYGKDSFESKDEFFVCKLPTGSWFGDYQILLNLKNTWRLVAHIKQKNKESYYDETADKNMVQIYSLKGSTWKKIL